MISTPLLVHVPLSVQDVLQPPISIGSHQDDEGLNGLTADQPAEILTIDNDNHISILTYIWCALILSWLRSDACLTLITAPSYNQVFVLLLVFPLLYDEWAIFRHQVLSGCCPLDVFLDVVTFNSSTEVPTSLLQWVACTAFELRHSVGNQDY